MEEKIDLFLFAKRKNEFISTDYLLSIDMPLFEKETLTDEIRESSDAIVIYFYQLQN